MDTSSQLFSSSSSKPMGEASININTATTTTTTTTSACIHIDMNITSSINSISSSSSSRRRSKEMESLSFELSKYPRDLLQTFMRNQSSSTRSFRSDEEDEEGLNLGLGLSLGGKFGVDKSKDKGLLIRSASIAGTMPLFREKDTAVEAVAPPQKTPVSGLVRTSSLPVETEEEWRKRKEMQTLRRIEAKRRRSEKQKSLKDGGCGEEKGVEIGLKLRARLEREQQFMGLSNKFIGSSMGNLFGSSNSKPPPPPSSSNNVEVKGRRTTFGSLQGFLMAQAQAQAQPQPGLSQGSGESQGGACSSSELKSRTHQGASTCGEPRSPPSARSQQDRASHESSIGPFGTKDDSIPGASRPEPETSSKQPESTEDNKKREIGSSGIEDMPCVFTIGDGPNGRKVEGILYKYGKGEEVHIMCVCHGNFYSPAEFVKHAGGKDVDHPLRHIVVSPSTSPFQ